MAEPFARPQKKDIDNLMKFAEDPLFYWAMTTGIKALDGLGKEDASLPIQEFYRNCRLMILNYPAIQVYSILDMAVYDIANQSYENLSVPEPNQKPKVNYSKIDLKELTLTKIADYYGLEPLGRNLRVCPFHKDKDPSLSLSNDKNCFHCFGCNVSGDVFVFIGMMEELKNGV